MDKITIKKQLKNIERDLNYYINNYGLSQKEAYEEIHKIYYIRMMLTKSYVEIDEREKIYKSFKEDKNEK